MKRTGSEKKREHWNAMLTAEDLQAIHAMMQTLLEEHGLRKTPSAAALRQQRYRERQHNASVTGHNESVTPSPAKRNGTVTKRNASVTHSDEPNVIAIPLNDGSEFGVTASNVAEWAALYPAVDVPQTLREIRGWSLGNKQLRKTRNGCLRFIAGWLQREQNKG